MDACKTLLLDSRLVLVGALFDVVEEDHWSALAEHLVTVFEQHRRSTKLMIWALRKEIACTGHVRLTKREEKRSLTLFFLCRFTICFVWTARRRS